LNKEYAVNISRLLAAIFSGVLLLSVAGTTLNAAEKEAADWPFFAFDNGVGRGSWEPERQARVLAELGYDGIGYTGVKNIPAMLKALDAHNLRMFSTYVRLNLQKDSAPYDPQLPEAIEQLSGEGTAIWLHVHAGGAANAERDRRAVKLIRQIAEMAATADLPVVLYPHTGFYVATTPDAVRIAKLVGRDNVGVAFNLCHFLKQADPEQLETRIREALPHLKLVSINGADSGDTPSMSWDRLIQTLDQGSFEVPRVLRELKRGGYQGPIGLQCYAIKGDIRRNLERSIAAWNSMRTGIMTPAD
jgi:sugar phosphate isomerase/epimerase